MKSVLGFLHESLQHLALHKTKTNHHLLSSKSFFFTQDKLNKSNKNTTPFINTSHHAPPRPTVDGVTISHHHHRCGTIFFLPLPLSSKRRLAAQVWMKNPPSDPRVCLSLSLYGIGVVSMDIAPCPFQHTADPPLLFLPAPISICMSFSSQMCQKLLHHHGFIAFHVFALLL